MKRALSLVALAVFLPLAASAALSSVDREYLTSAMQTQLGRYALATLAEKQAGSARVKQLAKSIAGEATRQTRALDALAKKHGVPVATHSSVRDRYHYSRLIGVHGTAFDRRFVQELLVDDQIASSNERSQMRHGQDSELRAFAAHRYRALANELRMLRSVKF